MGLFEKVFGNRIKKLAAEHVFKTFTSYTPAFTSWNGALYEADQVRAAVEAWARHVSKLNVEFTGSAKPKLQNRAKHQPNEWMTWGQFMARVATILLMQDTCFIVPVEDFYGGIQGFYPLLPSRCSIVESDGVVYLKYQFMTGDIAAVELNRCGIMTRFQYLDDFFGEENRALTPIMEVIDLQNQGIEEAIKQGASFRFMARLTNFKDPDDLKEEQKNFSDKNFSADSGSFLLFPNTYQDIKQIVSRPYTVDATQMKLIQTRIENYFAVNEKVTNNTATGEELDGFYEGAIEPFAIQLSEVLTMMTYTLAERSNGNRMNVTANRLQYMKTSDKVNLVRELSDRGFLKVNEGRALFNYPLLPEKEGNLRPIRGEFYLMDDEGKIVKKDGEDNAGKE